MSTAPKPPAFLLCAAKDGNVGRLVYMDADKKETLYCPFHYWATIEREFQRALTLKRFEKESKSQVTQE